MYNCSKTFLKFDFDEYVLFSHGLNNKDYIESYHLLITKMQKCTFEFLLLIISEKNEKFFTVTVSQI